MPFQQEDITVTPTETQTFTKKAIPNINLNQDEETAFLVRIVDMEGQIKLKRAESPTSNP